MQLVARGSTCRTRDSRGPPAPAQRQWNSRGPARPPALSSLSSCLSVLLLPDISASAGTGEGARANALNTSGLTSQQPCLLKT